MVNNSVLELKKILNGMEDDLGLSKLSEVERNVLYAIKDLEKEYGTAKTGNLLSHEFTSKMSRISFLALISAEPCNCMLVSLSDDDFSVLS